MTRKMTISAIKNKFPNLFEIVSKRIEKNIYKKKEFLSVIEKERERANRNSHELSLIIFNLNIPEIDSAELLNIIHQMSSRIRSIDEIGLYDKNCIGIILPYTDLKGANRFAERISKSIGFIFPKSTCQIHSYPFGDLLTLEK